MHVSAAPTRCARAEATRLQLRVGGLYGCHSLGYLLSQQPLSSDNDPAEAAAHVHCLRSPKAVPGRGRSCLPGDAVTNALRESDELRFRMDASPRRRPVGSAI